MKRNSFLGLFLVLLLISCGQQGGNTGGNRTNELSKESVKEEQKLESDQEKGLPDRVGNEVVGFVRKPEGWGVGDPKGASPNAVQIGNGSASIMLDKMPAKNGVDASKALGMMYGELRKQGMTDENMTANHGKINGNNAYMIAMENNDGSRIMLIFIDANNEVYYVSIVAPKDSIMDVLEVVNSSWSAQ